MISARLAAPVRLSYALTCGCAQGKSEPVRAIDANTLPGQVIICERCQEYTVVLRVSVYLADTSADSLAVLLREGGVDDPLTVAQVAAEQAR